MQRRTCERSSGSGRAGVVNFPSRPAVHTVASMRPVRTLALLAALLLPGAAARAAPPRRPVPRPALEVQVSTHQRFPRADSLASGNHPLRDLPAPTERPGMYALVTRWVEQVTLPGPDGRPKLVLVTVRGGLGLAWARRW